MFNLKNHFVVRAIILVNCLVYYYVWSHGGVDSENLINFGANFRPLVVEGEWWRLFTCMFLHANLLHLGVNMYSLWALGSGLENLVGWRPTLLIYFTTGLAASLTSFLIHHDPVVGIGASGAIFGLFGTFASLVVRKKVMSRGGEVMTFRALSTPLIVNFAISLTPGIDLSAHLGGFVSGFFLGFLI